MKKDLLYKISERLHLGLEYERRRPPDEKGLINFLKRRFIKQNPINSKIIIACLNYCNLSCFSCGAVGASGLKKEITPIEDVITLLDRLKNWNKESSVLVYGGESTMLSDDYLSLISKTIRNHNRKVATMTNGFRLVDLNLFDRIIIDDHGINKEDVKKFLEHIKKTDWSGEYRINHSYYHIDINHARLGDTISKGLRCKNWMINITLWKDVIFPCCVLLSIERWDKDTIISDSLRDAGWSVENPTLAEYIDNWRETLPPEVYKKCLLSCWSNPENIRWRKL